MVTETVVKEPLTKEMIDRGADLAKRLDENNFAASAALWFFNLDSGSWRYIIASPQVDSVGMKASYRKIQETLGTLSNGDGSIKLRDITLLSPTDPLISLLKTAIRTGNDMSAIRFSKNLINGILIEDAYIYRLT